jgi:oxygen-independent coproporphyrinogen-3 oxidase
LIQIEIEGYKDSIESLKNDLRVLAGLFVPGTEVAFVDRDAALLAESKTELQKSDLVPILIKVNYTAKIIIAGFKSDGSNDFVHVQMNLEDGFMGKNQPKNLVKAAFYDLMSTRYVPHSGWGLLVGIRPVKIVHDLMDTGDFDPAFIKDYLQRHYRVSEAKAALAIDVARRERVMLFEKRDAVSLYICIPFCTTRCLYCSFPSNPVDKKGHLMGAYLNALLCEIEAIGQFLQARGRSVDCVYIGGGTPTSLSEEAFETLLAAVRRHLVEPLAPAEGLSEFTVEAGRPDTITEKKLRDMKRFGVNRLCINPQTLSDKTLALIGRDHGAEAIRQTFELAREVGFEVINADLIVGLPGECLEDVRNTVEGCLALRPENLTVHTLAVKRASRLNENREAHELGKEEAGVDAMYDLALSKCREAGYEPYYLYRLKNMLGNLENVGLTLPGHECLYNIRIMGDRHSIIALGAGSVSKLVWPETGRIERLSNAKGVEDYISRIETSIENKNQWLTQLY